MNERQAIVNQLYGVNSHAHLLHALEGLTARQAGQRTGPGPHTIFQVLHHMVYWQDLTLARLRGEKPAYPGSAELGWATPESPEDASDWEAAVASLAEGLRALEELVLDPRFDLDAVPDPARASSAREELFMVMGHNSYHLGQIVQLRRGLVAWPPPRGGDTW